MADYVHDGCYYCETHWEEAGYERTCGKCRRESCDLCSESLYDGDEGDEGVCILCRIDPDTEDAVELENIRHKIGSWNMDHVDIRIKKHRLLKFAESLKPPVVV